MISSSWLKLIPSAAGCRLETYHITIPQSVFLRQSVLPHPDLINQAGCAKSTLTYRRLRMNVLKVALRWFILTPIFLIFSPFLWAGLNFGYWIRQSYDYIGFGWLVRDYFRHIASGQSVGLLD